MYKNAYGMIGVGASLIVLGVFSSKLGRKRKVVEEKESQSEKLVIRPIRRNDFKELNKSMEELNKLFDEIFKLKEKTEEDKIRTQWRVKSTGEVLNKKNIDEKIENETDEEKKRFYEYLKSEFLT